MSALEYFKLFFVFIYIALIAIGVIASIVLGVKYGAYYGVPLACTVIFVLMSYYPVCADFVKGL